MKFSAHGERLAMIEDADGSPHQTRNTLLTGLTCLRNYTRLLLFVVVLVCLGTVFPDRGMCSYVSHIRH